MRNVGDLGRIGNHTLTDLEIADGVPARLPFQDRDGVVTVPDEVTLTIIKPDQTEVVYRWPTPSGDEFLLSAELGVEPGEENTRFYADIEYDQAGRWRAVLASTGALIVSEQLTITVQATYT